MKQKINMKSRLVKSLALSAVILCVVFVGLAITPNYACGCGEIENGTKLTYFVNQISKNLFGRKVF